MQEIITHSDYEACNNPLLKASFTDKFMKTNVYPIITNKKSLSVMIPYDNQSIDNKVWYERIILGPELLNDELENPIFDTSKETIVHNVNIFQIIEMVVNENVDSFSIKYDRDTIDIYTIVKEYLINIGNSLPLIHDENILVIQRDMERTYPFYRNLSRSVSVILNKEDNITLRENFFANRESKLYSLLRKEGSYSQDLSPLVKKILDFKSGSMKLKDKTDGIPNQGFVDPSTFTTTSFQ